MQTPVGPSIQLMLGACDVAFEFSVGGITALWERWLGPQRFSRKLVQLQRAGLVEPVGDATATSNQRLRLTARGHQAAWGGRDPYIHWHRPWDGRWRLAFFDVAESRRTQRIRLQRQLRRLGFGYLQDSVWVSPDDLAALRLQLGAAKVDAAGLTFIDGRPCGGETDADLVRGAWDFSRINRNYENHLEILRNPPGNAWRAARNNWLATEWRAWCDAVRHDPLLPEALLPRSYRGREAWKRRGETLRRLGRST